MKYKHRDGKQALWCLKDLAISCGCNEELVNHLVSDVGKELKALEIIKNQHVNVGTFVVYFGQMTYEYYLDSPPCVSCYASDKQLKKEEYELINEVLL